MPTTGPVIMLVDDDPASLAALREALERRFGRDYRLTAHHSANAALEELATIQGSGEELALIIADQWMPEMTGSELLGRVHQIAPGAKRALLVSWGDRTAAPLILRGCAFGQIDNYIVKPWAPPEVHLYPAVSEFLAEWTRAYGARMELVRVVGRRPSARANEIKELLERSGVPHGIYAVDSPRGQQLLAEAGLQGAKLPAVLLPDGQALLDPSNGELADLLGATELEDCYCDLAIAGAGPGGLAAAVYAASEGLRTIVVEREVVGGQAGMSALIRNYLGFPRGISGAELAQRAYQQAWLFGAKYVLAREALRLQARGTDRILVLSDGMELTTRAVLIATGARYRRLGIPQLEHFLGAGLYYTAGGDTRFMRGQSVFVTGGGNSAGQAVANLAKNAREVTLLVRGDSLEKDMSDYLIREIQQLVNVEIRLRSEVIGGEGDYWLRRILVRDHARSTTEALPADALFVLIGALPHTDWLAGALQRDRDGFIVTGRDVDRATAGWPLSRSPLRFETSMPGVFAAGDVRLGSAKRVASAVGEGAAAVRDVHEYLTSPCALEVRG